MLEPIVAATVLVDRSPDLQASIIANYRLTVYQHASGLLDVVGWLVGELGYLGRLGVRARHRGLRVYAVSWRETARRLKRLRQSRDGRVRPDVESVRAR